MIITYKLKRVLAGVLCFVNGTMAILHFVAGLFWFGLFFLASAFISVKYFQLLKRDLLTPPTPEKWKKTK